MITISKPLYQHKPAPSKRTLRGRRLQRIRQRIFEQAGYRCAGCKRITPDLELDHIIPLEQGGKDEESNYQPLCADGRESCHAKKTARERADRLTQ